MFPPIAKYLTVLFVILDGIVGPGNTRQDPQPILSFVPLPSLLFWDRVLLYIVQADLELTAVFKLQPF